MRCLVGIQARSNSKRLPGKIYKEIAGKSLLQHVYDSCKAATALKRAVESFVIVLGPAGDDELQHYCAKNNMESIFVDNEDDLITRYVVAAREYKADAVIRVTADCWSLPTAVVEEAVKSLCEVDYASNTVIRSFPEGWDAQGCSAKALKWFDENQKEQREHPFVLFDQNQLIRDEFVKAGFQWRQLLNNANPIFVKQSIDTPEELAAAKKQYG